MTNRRINQGTENKTVPIPTWVAHYHILPLPRLRDHCTRRHGKFVRVIVGGWKLFSGQSRAAAYEFTVVEAEYAGSG